jgi:hypothetical protein
MLNDASADGADTFSDFSMTKRYDNDSMMQTQSVGNLNCSMEFG